MMGNPGYRLAVAVMVLDKDNKVLLVKGYRGWEFPGGYVGEGEPIEDAAIREVKEESGVIIQLTKLCGIDQDVMKSTCVFLFKGNQIGGKLTTSDESSEVGYFTIDEAIHKISLKSFQDRIARCLNENEHPYINIIKRK